MGNHKVCYINVDSAPWKAHMRTTLLLDISNFLGKIQDNIL